MNKKSDKMLIDLDLYEKSESFKKLVSELPQTIASIGLIAKLYKSSYDALKDVGFSDSQAIELLKERGWFLK